MAHEDIILELARTTRELTQQVERRLRERQLGEAWIGLVDDRRPIEGSEQQAA